MLQRALYDAVRYNWRRIAESQVPHLYVEFKKEIGASKGKPSSFVRFDLDYSKGGVHSHPIQPEEKPAEEKWLSDLTDGMWGDMDELFSNPVIDEEIEYEITDESAR